MGLGESVVASHARRLDVDECGLGLRLGLRLGLGLGLGCLVFDSHCAQQVISCSFCTRRLQSGKARVATIKSGEYKVSSIGWRV